MKYWNVRMGRCGRDSEIVGVEQQIIGICVLITVIFICDSSMYFY